MASTIDSGPDDRGAPFEWMRTAARLFDVENSDAGAPNRRARSLRLHP